MTSSSSDAIADGKAGETSSFSLWPLADLGSPTAISVDPRRAPEGEQAAYENGYAEGVRAANLDAEREILASLDSIRQALAKAQNEREEERRLVEENAYAIAVAVARQIIHRELEQDDTVIKGLVARAIDKAGAGAVLEIRMNEHDLEMVRDEMHVVDETGNPRAIRWIADTTMARGACIVETPQRLVDGGVDTALVRVFQTLCND